MTNVILTVLIFAFGMMPRELDLLMSCSSGSVTDVDRCSARHYRRSPVGSDFWVRSTGCVVRCMTSLTIP